MTLGGQIEAMLQTELRLGGRAAQQYALLSAVERKDMVVDGLPCQVRFNPGRVRSVMADVSAEALAQRACFLCPDGLEEKQQTFVWDNYFIRVNPFPIFSRHFTISSAIHEPQRLDGHYEAMLRLAEALPDYVVFYNGPRCGASAPDHMHFQAVPIRELPLQVWCDEHIGLTDTCSLHKLPLFCPSAYLISSPTSAGMDEQRKQLMAQMGRDINVITWVYGGHFRSLIIFRSKSRPDCFYAENPAERILFSPATVEMAGIGIVASRDAFEKLNPDTFYRIIQEVSI